VTDCRLLIDPPAAGAWNMAVDDVLMEWAGHTGGCAWRFYRWEVPTLSLGYFQPYEARYAHAGSGSCPVVRRPSGGGAILHDRELTYSLSVPIGHRLASRRRQLYDAVHQTLIETLGQRGLAAELCPGTSPDRAPHKPFLCFQRRSPGDVLLGPIKIAGSAQRRSREAVLQHGSVLLARSAAAPELDGVSDVAAYAIDPEPLITAWLDRLARRLALAWYSEPLSDGERARAAELVRGKYGSDDWTRYRGRRRPEPPPAA
jgi:lipoate-protein ligase A